MRVLPLLFIPLLLFPASCSEGGEGTVGGGRVLQEILPSPNPSLHVLTAVVPVPYGTKAEEVAAAALKTAGSARRYAVAVRGKTVIWAFIFSPKPEVFLVRWEEKSRGTWTAVGADRLVRTDRRSRKGREYWGAAGIWLDPGTFAGLFQLFPRRSNVFGKKRVRVYSVKYACTPKCSPKPGELLEEIEVEVY